MMRPLALLFTALTLASPAFAEEITAPPVPDTRIEADDEADVIRFVVKGQLAAILDETGLHIRNDLAYGGVTMDDGPDGFDAHAHQPAGASDAP